MTISDLIKCNVEIDNNRDYISYSLILNNYIIDIDKNYLDEFKNAAGKYQLYVLTFNYIVINKKDFYENM